MRLASERQISANQRNAARSTGPRSAAGKRRPGQNACSHGLTASLTSGAEAAKWLDECARKIAGDGPTAIVLEQARVAAQAEFDLARIRHIKVALLERAFAFGALEPPQDFEPLLAELRYLKSVVPGQARSIKPQRTNALTTMPSQELERTAETVRGTLAELEKLSRYDARAASRRDRAIREIVKIRSSGDRRPGQR